MSSNEIWARSPSFDFLSVSTWGRLLIDPYSIDMPNGGKKFIKTKPTLGCKSKAYGGKYRYLFINKKNGVKGKKVHQLIAEAFLGPKPFENAVVMHLDDNPMNNRVDNLKWGSQKENLNAEGFINHCKSRRGINSNHAKHRRNLNL